MKSQRAILTPHMPEYTERLYIRGTVRWVPYLMYFHPVQHSSGTVNTDRLGFRISHGVDDHASPGGRIPEGPVNVLAGSSVVFGTGATADTATLPSRLWTDHAPGRPWLNFGARAYNATQELLLFTLHRHLVPRVERIVILSGFNNLALARLPRSKQGDHGAFFRCDEYLKKMDELMGGGPRNARRLVADDHPAEPAQQIDDAAGLTLRHLDTWRLLADALGARLAFVLQPLAPWVRAEPAPQEKLLFDELDQDFSFTETYRTIATSEAGQRYADALRAGCDKLGVRFLDLNPVLADAAGKHDWLFVDRIHLTDQGYDLVARLLTDQLGLV